MAFLAERFPVALIPEQPLVSPVRYDVILGKAGSSACSGQHKDIRKADVISTKLSEVERSAGKKVFDGEII